MQRTHASSCPVACWSMGPRIGYVGAELAESIQNIATIVIFICLFLGTTVESTSFRLKDWWFAN